MPRYSIPLTRQVTYLCTCYHYDVYWSPVTRVFKAQYYDSSHCYVVMHRSARSYSKDLATALGRAKTKARQLGLIT